ncbi:MAG: lauroyl acyltransferase [Rhodospirillales bacterium CG15_BIG_FIL_POST_REV_8_21_14_020_66_15]|nr:MAG: lauroyl acyltransferase [Rhodospirillales bacterium CG15_BIG_FIL_POST_REV_8_21_14_020_66_15]
MAHVPAPLNRYLFHPVEAAAAFAVYMFFRFLPLDWASALGGFLGRTIGPRLRLSNRARRNLRAAYPEMAEADIKRIVRGMWDNLGRVAAEFPHLDEIEVYGGDGRVRVEGAEYVDQLRDDGEPGIFYSAHIGNWEILALGATQRGLPLDRVYREANNRLVEWLYQHGRAAVEGALIPKGPQGVRQLLNIFRAGSHLGMLVDQKMNDGIPVPFFGRPAMTAPALAELALRHGCPVVGARVTRLKGARFKMTALPPLRFEKTGDHKADVLKAMTQINAQVETWVRDTPEQWLWLHNRWPGGEE